MTTDNLWLRAASSRVNRRKLVGGAAFAGLGAASLALVGCGGGSGGSTTPGAESTGNSGSSPAAASGSPTAAASATPAANLKSFKTVPEKGHIGESFAISTGGLPAKTTVEFFWKTAEGDYITQIVPADVKYIDRTFPAKRVSLGKAETDAQGNVTATFVVPEDFGETHDIYAAVDGKDVAKAGYRVLRTVDISPKEGVLGDPITITVKGLGIQSFESTMAVLYDHKYTGFLTGTRNRGTAVFQIRAAGPVGTHLVEVIGASTALPYLNNWQSPTSLIPWEFRSTFNVTADRGAPAETVEWPEASRVATLAADAPRTGQLSAVTANQRAVMEPGVGPILTKSTLKASNLPPNADVDLVWVTAAGSDVSGWDVTGVSLAKARSGADGTLSTAVQIPEGLGGWHSVEVTQGDKILALAPFRVDRSIVGVSPKRVKVGETFQVQIKGLGWTQIDNGIAATYDNSFIGFACGFGTGGDITINMVATGVPGTHLIDLYPMIYQGARGLQGTAKPPWVYMVPFLTALRDYPGLALGYNLPIFRMAVEVTE